MGASLDASLYYGRPLKESADVDLAGLFDSHGPDGVEWVTWGYDFAGKSVAVSASLTEAYHRPKWLDEATPGVLPARGDGWDDLLDYAIAAIGLTNDFFEPAGWYLSPSYA